MNKQEFLNRLRKGLHRLPKKDIEERLGFYSEIIDDKIEEGLLEEEAISAVGPVEKIIEQIIADTPLLEIAKERIKPIRPLKVLEIIFLILGSPIWLALLLSVFAVVLSIYICLWAVIVSLWAVFASLAACSLGLIAAGIIFAFNNNLFPGLAAIAAGIALAGFSLFFFYLCKASAKGILVLTKKITILIKNCFIKKEEVQ